jgi:hypothetical protein
MPTIPISGRLDTKTRKRASSLGLRVSSRPSAARRRRHPPIAGVCQQGETEHRAQSLNRLVEESLALALVGARQRGARIARTRPRRAAGACRPRANSTGRANLVRNAVEAIEQVERRELTIGTRAISQQAMVELTIADTGAGIAPELAGGPPVPTVRDNEGNRHGSRLVDLPGDRRSASRASHHGS